MMPPNHHDLADRVNRVHGLMAKAKEAAGFDPGPFRKELMSLRELCGGLPGGHWFVPIYGRRFCQLCDYYEAVTT